MLNLVDSPVLVGTSVRDLFFLFLSLKFNFWVKAPEAGVVKFCNTIYNIFYYFFGPDTVSRTADSSTREEVFLSRTDACFNFGSV